MTASCIPFNSGDKLNQESSQSSPEPDSPQLGSPGILPPGDAPAPIPTREAAFAVLAGFLGWTLDAFDFFLVVIALPAIAQDFGVDKPKIAFSLMLTLMFRPVGAFLFGLLADRYGRRLPMMIDLVFYSVVEVATAFAPNLTTFLVLRALFGIGMGGEWGVGMSLVMEKVPAAGEECSAGCCRKATRPATCFPPWLPGSCSIASAGGRCSSWAGCRRFLALFIRFGIRESEIWKRTKAASWSHLARELASHWRIWIYLTLLMAMMNFASHGTQDMFPTFMESFRGLDTRTYSQVVIVMMIGAILGGLAFGLASDRWGRRAMMIAAFLGALAVTPLWAFSSGMAAILSGGFLMQFMVQGAWGIIPAHISELSPDRVRGFLPGFSYQCGNLIAASIALLQASLAERFDYPYVMATSAAVIFVFAILVTAAGRERRGAAFGITKDGDCGPR